MKKMNKCIISIMMVVSMLLSLIPVNVYGADMATEIHIRTIEEWNSFAKNAHYDAWSKGKTIYLDADLDFEGMEVPYISVFAGTFEGNNHVIHNMELNANGHSEGLFRYIEKGAVVENFTVEGTVTSESEQKRLGGIVGSNAGIIRNVVFDGSVVGNNETGGIAGINEFSGEIYNCTVKGTITGTYTTGGISGKNAGIIRDCTNFAEVNTDSSWLEDKNSVEDVVGFMSETDSLQFVNGMDAGGIVGYSDGLVASCVNRGNVGFAHSGYNIGGIAGRQSGIITSSENYGKVLGRKDVGGIVGQMEPFIEANDAESISKATKKLHDLVNKMLDDAELTSDVVNGDFDRLQSFVDGAVDDTDSISNQLSDFTDSNIDMINDLSSRVEYIIDHTPAILDDIDDAMAAMEDVSDDIKRLNDDLNIEEDMKNSGEYDETDFKTLSLISGVGGTLKTSNTDPEKGTEVTITAKPDTGYALSSLKLRDAKNRTVTCTVSATDSNVCTFTMPDANVAVYAEFAPTGSFFVESTYGGRVTYTEDDDAYTFRITPYEDSDYTALDLGVHHNDFDVSSIVIGTNDYTSQLVKDGDSYKLTVNKSSIAFNEGNMAQSAIVTFKQNSNSSFDYMTDTDEEGQTVYKIKRVSSTGGTVISSASTASRGDKITVTVTAKPGYRYVSGSLSVWGNNVSWNAHDNSDKIVRKISDEEDVYEFVIPDNVNSGVFVAAEFEPVPVILSSSTGGKAAYSITEKNGVSKVRVIVTPSTGYTVKSVTAENWNGGFRTENISISKIKAGSFEYEYVIPENSDYTTFRIEFKHEVSDYQTVEEAKNRIETNSTVLSNSLNSASNTIDEIYEIMENYGYQEGDTLEDIVDKMNDEDQSEIISKTYDLAGYLGDAMTALATITSDVSTISSILGPYVDDATDAVSNDLDRLSDDIDDVGSALRSANRRTSKIVDYLDSLDSIEFSKLGDEFDDSMDSLLDNLRGVSNVMGDLSDHMDYYSEILLDDMRAINDQMDHVMQLILDKMDMLEDADYSIGMNYYEDMSEENIEASTSGKVKLCINYGFINGDVNVGGIAGSMAIDDTDPESDAAGDSSSGFINKYVTKCVISDSINYGYIESKRDGAGGIVGYMVLGVVYQSQAYGSVESSEGGYVGGICGESKAVIRNSYAMVTLGGERYIGGIVGYGDKIVDCYSMPLVTESEGHVGAIAGQLRSIEEEDDTYFENVKNNFYVSDDIYGIDDISYMGVAEPITYEDLMQVNGLPDEFRHLQVILIVDEEEVGRFEMEYGASLEHLELPLIESKDGEYALWPDLPTKTMTNNIILTAEYNDMNHGISSLEKTADGKAYAIIMGEFTEDVMLHVVSTHDELPIEITEKSNDIHVFKVSVVNSTIGDDDITPLRVYNFGDEDAVIYQYINEEWVLVDSESKKTYTQVEMTGTNAVYAVVSMKSKNQNLWLIGGILIGAAAVVGVVTVRKKKRTKIKAKA